jgi:mycoredoxin
MPDWLSRMTSRNRKAGPEEASAVDRDIADPAAVTIYTTNWCASCLMAKRYLESKGVSYEEINIEAEPAAAELVMSLARGYKTVPTMIVGETVVVDWDRKALEQALAAAGLA